MAEKGMFPRLGSWWRGSSPQAGAKDNPETPPPAPKHPSAPAPGKEAPGQPAPMKDAGARRPELKKSGKEELGPPSAEAMPASGSNLELEAEIKRLTEKLEKRNQHVESLREQRNELHNQLREAQEAVAALEARLKEKEAGGGVAAPAPSEHSEEAIRLLRQEKEGAEARLRELDAELKESRARADSTLREREAQAQTLQAELTQAHKRAQALEEALRRAETQTRESPGGPAAENARVEQLQAERHLAEERAGKLEAELAAQKAVVEQLQAEWRGAEERARGVQAELAAQKLLLERLRAEKEAAEKRTSALEAELHTQKALVEQLQTEKAAPAAAAPEVPPAAITMQEVDLTEEWERSGLSEAAVAQPAAVEAAPSVEAVPPEPAAPVETVPAAAAPPPSAEPPSPPAERKKKRILVVEDDAAIRRIVEMSLQKAGLDVITAEDGEDAFAKAVQERPDAILTDIKMPRMDGFELCAKLKSTPTTTRIPVGFLTAQRELESYKQALDLGSTLYITKPFRPDNLITFVNVLLRGKKSGHRRS